MLNKGFFLAWTLGLAGAATASPIVHQKFKHDGIYYHAVIADLNSGKFSAGMAHSPRLTSVWNLISQDQPLVAITGTFFAPRGGIPVADVVLDGRLVARGSRGSGIGVDWAGNVKIFDAGFQQVFDWNPYQWGLRGAVRVVSNRQVQPNPKAQNFTDKRIWGNASRTGVGLTAHNKLVFIATQHSVTLSQLGRAMVSRGIVDGISLDGGGSTCLYYDGSLLIPPKRQLSNLFVLKMSPTYLAERKGTKVASAAP